MTNEQAIEILWWVRFKAMGIEYIANVTVNKDTIGAALLMAIDALSKPVPAKAELNPLIEEEIERISTLGNALDSLDDLYEDFTVEEYKVINDAYKTLEDKICEHEQKIERLQEEAYYE